jgi:hypothetical protein
MDQQQRARTARGHRRVALTLGAALVGSSASCRDAATPPLGAGPTPPVQSSISEQARGRASQGEFVVASSAVSADSITSSAPSTGSGTHRTDTEPGPPPDATSQSRPGDRPRVTQRCGSATCTMPDEVCCLAPQTTGAPIGKCVPRPAGGASELTRDPMPVIHACQAAWPEFMRGGPGQWFVAGCLDSSACRPGDLCLTERGRAALADCATVRSGRELCTARSCRTRGTVCAPGAATRFDRGVDPRDPIAWLGECMPPARVYCGATACSATRPICCTARPESPRCTTHAGCPAHPFERPRPSGPNALFHNWACARREQCGPEMMCCLDGFGQSACEYDCAEAHATPACARDADCHDDPEGRALCRVTTVGANVAIGACCKR